MSWAITFGSLLFALGVGCGVLILAISSKFPKMGPVLGILFFVGLGIGFVVLRDRITDSLIEHVWPDSSLFLSGVILSTAILPRLRRSKEAGALLLDLGRIKRNWAIIYSVGMILFGAIWLSLQIAGSHTTKGTAALALYFLSFGFSILCTGLGRLEIRERGIWCLEGLLKWEWIESYAWEGEDRQTLTVWVQRPSVIRAWSWLIPPFQKEAVGSLLTQYRPLMIRDSR